MSSHKIDIAKYLSKLESSEMRNPLTAIQSCSQDLACEIRVSLGSKENLETVNDQTPLLDNHSTECIMWAAAILASSWTEWIFVSKSSNLEYQQHPDKRQAGANAKVACPTTDPSGHVLVVGGVFVGGVFVGGVFVGGVFVGGVNDWVHDGSFGFFLQSTVGICRYL